jgi:peroxiredoxin Q/BCP
MGPSYFDIGRGRTQPYKIVMFEARVLGSLLLAAALSLGCSRPSGTEAPGSSPPTASTALPLASGAVAPDVVFPLHTGEQVALGSLRGKPVVVYFYPKDDTPGCTVEAQDIRDLYEQLKQTGAVVIGVSTDSRESHRAFAQKHELPFLLASDEAGKIAQAFGVPLKNGRASRQTFVIGADGRIKRVFLQVNPKGHAAELLAALAS